jgi:hypothetical protein
VWRGLFGMGVRLELHGEVDWWLSDCRKCSYFASRDSGQSRGSPGKIKCQHNSRSRLLPPRVFILLPPPLTSLTAVSSSILRCKSSKMPCPNRASADMMGGCICCVLLDWCGRCLEVQVEESLTDRGSNLWRWCNYNDNPTCTSMPTCRYVSNTRDMDDRHTLLVHRTDHDAFRTLSIVPQP